MALIDLFLIFAPSRALCTIYLNRILNRFDLIFLCDLRPNNWEKKLLVKKKFVLSDLSLKFEIANKFFSIDF